MSIQYPPEKRINVLIADDDAMVRLLTRSALEKLDLDLDEARNGAEAVARFEERPFDLVLLDLEMPVLDGFAACSTIRALPGGDTATLIVITGLDDFSAIQRAYELGATDFVTKPINWSLLIQRMHYILRARGAFQALKEKEDKLFQAQQIAHLGYWDWDVKRNRAEWSAQVYDILGRTPQACEASYSAFLDAVHPQDRAAVNRVICQAMERGIAYTIEHRVVLPNGLERTVFSQGKTLSDDSDGTLMVHSILQDISERKLAEERIYQLANYDTLTGLPNRSMFMAFGRRLLAATQQNSSKLAVLLLNLDRFKRINDSLGQTTGDELLKKTAGRIATYARHSELIAKTRTGDGIPYTLARPSGDDFMLLIHGLKNADGIANFVDRLLTDLARPVETDQHEIFIKASVGIALYPGDGEDLESLLANGGAALERAKDAGGACFRFYAKDMNQRAAERLSLESRLNRAVGENELELYYQPQIGLTNDRLKGFEALLRWRTKEGESIPPGKFIPIAEETGLIVEIGAWVLNRACTQLASWQKEGYALVPVAINLAALQFTNRDLIETVTQILSFTGLHPGLLELELTERTIMRDVDETRAKLLALKAIGVKLSVDDFGTGYSSMSYLKRFPLDTLKIDRSFVKDLETDVNDEAIVRAVVAMSRGLGLSTIAEGVETERQREILVGIGCDMMQGYLFSRPVPADQAVEFLTR